MPIIIGSILCILAGVGVGAFLLPLKFSRHWKWENSWLVGAFFMYVLFPLITLKLVVPRFLEIYQETPFSDLLMIFLFGLIQGTGAFTFTYGTTVFGLALGYALMIGTISLVSLLVPLFGAHADRLHHLDGLTLLIGCGVLIIGIAAAGKAGLMRERTQTSGSATRKRVSLLKATLIVLWAGAANSLFYFTFEFQKVMKDRAVTQYGVPEHFWGFLNILPFFLGMFSVNFILTVAKMVKDKSLNHYWSAEGLLREYALSISIGLLWYLGQGVCYTAGHTLLGPLGVAIGAALFMGTMMIVSNVAGIRTGEWNSVSHSTRRWLYTALGILVVAMTIIALGNYWQQQLNLQSK
ncbi:MAG: L-rhamnose/proton symporter RhaT [Terriglobia bacterium]